MTLPAETWRTATEGYPDRGRARFLIRIQEPHTLMSSQPISEQGKSTSNIKIQAHSDKRF